MSQANQNFTPLFQKGERLEIYGEKRFNFKVLILILTFTFCSIGGANLALSDLEDKMSDPFVNLLSVDIPLRQQRLVEDLKSHLSQDSLKSKYNYANITNYVEFPVQFSGPTNEKWVKGRSIDLNNPVLERLLEDDNLVAGSGFKMENEIGLIISERMLDELGYENTPSHILMTFDEMDVPIPIRAIVKELPELNYFVASPFFYFQRTQLGGSAFRVIDNKRLSLFLPNSENAREFTTKLNSFFKTTDEYKDWDAEILQRINSESFREGTEFTLDFFGFRPRKSTDYDQLVNDLNGQLSDYEFIRYYDYEYNNFPSSFQIESDKIAINFTGLDQVRDFQEYLYDGFRIEMDIAKVRDKENFALVKLLTESISMLLIAFSIVSICFYLYNLLKSHLDKIRPNLGTFMAFGLDRSNLFVLYRGILMSFLIQATAISLVGSFVLLAVVSASIGALDNYFALFDWKLLVTVVILIGSFYIIYKRTIQTILDKTPGDLIYDR
ncbi:MAG: hypothetical protein JXQ90_02695 [Cyclobacteriaceae bacterium]